jgi:hypothetical protein
MLIIIQSLTNRELQTVSQLHNQLPIHILPDEIQQMNLL